MATSADQIETSQPLMKYSYALGQVTRMLNILLASVEQCVPVEDMQEDYEKLATYLANFHQTMILKIEALISQEEKNVWDKWYQEKTLDIINKRAAIDDYMNGIITENVNPETS